MDADYPIQMVARLTGLSPYVIRIWEQRYRAVEPRRTPTNRRLYSRSDVERLSLLRDLTQAGHRIGRLAPQPDARLRRLAAESSGPKEPAIRAGTAAGGDALLDECLAAILALDRRRLEPALQRGVTALGAQGVLQRLVAPLAQALGSRWWEGGITAAHEHFATGILRSFLAGLARPYAGGERAPVVVVATPAGQLHEVGALLVGALAANLGWQVIQLGASLPAAEIAGAARQQQARAVALSLVYPDDDPHLAGELRTLRESLPRETAILAGGRALPAYREALAGIGAVLLEDLAQLPPALLRLRTRASRRPR